MLLQNAPGLGCSGIREDSLQKLFGKSDWVPNRDSEGRQEETKDARLAAFRRQSPTLEQLQLFSKQFIQHHLALVSLSSLNFGCLGADLERHYGPFAPQ